MNRPNGEAMPCSPRPIVPARRISSICVLIPTAAALDSDAIAGADEALMMDPHGFVASCHSTNFFSYAGANCGPHTACTALTVLPTARSCRWRAGRASACRKDPLALSKHSLLTKLCHRTAGRYYPGEQARRQALRPQRKSRDPMHPRLVSGLFTAGGVAAHRQSPDEKKPAEIARVDLNSNPLTASNITITERYFMTCITKTSPPVRGGC